MNDSWTIRSQLRLLLVAFSVIILLVAAVGFFTGKAPEPALAPASGDASAPAATSAPAPADSGGHWITFGVAAGGILVVILIGTSIIGRVEKKKDLDLWD